MLKSQLCHGSLDCLSNLFVRKILQQKIEFKVVEEPFQTLQTFLNLSYNYFLIAQNLPCKNLAILYISTLLTRYGTSAQVTYLSSLSFEFECLNLH